jgi:hypothetical protein
MTATATAGMKSMPVRCAPLQSISFLRARFPRPSAHDGMDSRQIVARFEAERQALAMMDHANIARIFDVDLSMQARRP